MEELIDIQNINSEVEEFSNKIENLRQQIIRVGLDYVNKIGGLGSENTDLFFSYRNSFIHRLLSINFHVRQQIDFENEIPKLMDSNNGSYLVGGLILGFDLGQQLTYLFEDIIFNLGSLLDYLARIVSFPFNKNYTKWTSLVNDCSPNGQGSLKNLNIASAISDESNRQLLNTIYNYRSIVIHENAYYARVIPAYNVRISPDISNHSIKVYSPEAFVKKFKELKEQKKLGKIHSLRYTTFWVVKNCFIRIDEILQKLKQDIEESRKIPKAHEPYKIKLDD